MILLPNFLKQFKEQADAYLSAGLIKEIEFSGSTYQVLLYDPKVHKKEWVFLQLDQQGSLKDSFCSCATSEKQHACVHQAAAFLSIYGSHAIPLHQRFEKSFWNKLCRLCFEHFGASRERIKKGKKGEYIAEKRPVKIQIEGKTQEMQVNLESFFFQPLQATEENSLKFSNLSEGEIALWRQGRPSPKLAYELSFWNDLAKWLLKLQEKEPNLLISFKNVEILPNGLVAEFAEMRFEANFPSKWLPELIPALKMLPSSLSLHSSSKAEIEKIRYDAKQKKLHILPKSKDARNPLPSGKKIGDWIYVPRDGFYSTTLSFLEMTEWDDVEKVLNEHASELKEFMEGTTIHEAPAMVSYQIEFDKNWNLHIECYLFKPGDLSEENCAHFGTWAYLDGKGFYRLGKRYFDEIKLVISENEINDFVNQHRTWLNVYEGFRSYVNPIEANLTYKIREDNALIFNRGMDIQEKESKDFGRWIYVKGVGFFSKISLETGLPIRSDAAIASHLIPQFIRTHRKDLSLVHQFFSNRNPILKSGLNIELLSDETISISPHYELKPEYQERHLQFFDDFVYIPSEGFYELPPNMRLPERYHSPTLIIKEETPSFLTDELPKLIPFAHFLDPKLRIPHQGRLLALNIEHQEGDKEYTLDLHYQTDLGTLSISSLWWALQKNEKYLFTEAGLIDLSESRFAWLKRIGKKSIDRQANKLKLSTIELLKINTVEEIVVSSSQKENEKKSLRILKNLSEFNLSEEPDITGLVSQLRPYQWQGVRWLYFLYLHGLSGLLCDDMGLGKTHQAMALLISVINHWRKHHKQEKGHFLIICPTSVIYHWQEKLNLYAPELRVGTFYGAKRSLETFYEGCDVLLTSFGVWRNEAELLSSLSFEVAIFDELQIAKNQTSRIYNALLKANARIRIGMTGTPIENQLRELKSLFDIVLPGYMPPENTYRELFIKPIEKEGNVERRHLLSRLVKPFVLRRKKEDVLTDLPEKIEEISHCELLPQQRQLYVDVLALSRDKIIAELQDESVQIPYIHIFALLSQLKQICDHPAVFLKKPQDYKEYQSGKWELFLELLEEARESSQKVVVFSQFLSMLDIIESHLKEHKIGYAAIRGSTTNRGEQIHRFNQDPDCQVFVASLQAAGLGVDLTAASVVIHYDRWWNAARENQATDRVHRIGQTRGVQVFKLMIKGTLEEHIDFLISKKGKLMNEIIGIDDHEVIKKINRQEMIQLLQELPKE